MTALEKLQEQIVDCEACPRLRDHSKSVAEAKRPAYPAKSGKYEVEIQYAATEFNISIGDIKVMVKVEDTGGNWVIKKFTLREVALKAGEQVVKVSAKTQGTEAIKPAQ